MTQSVLVSVAWPYANGPRHIGHVAGFGVPSDVFARYQRMIGNDVLMISGTDEHGTPLLVQADKENVTVKELADRYNRQIVEDLAGLGLSYDLFTRTTTRNHYAVVQELFKGLTHIGHYRQRYFTPGRRNGHIVYEWRLQPGADDAIYQSINDITLSMKAIDHLDMPPVTTIDRTVPLSAEALATYRRLRDDMVTDLDDETIIADSAGVLAGKLQQLASGAIYTDDGSYRVIHDEKLQALEDIIEQAQGQNILVAYWFKHELARLRERFPHGRLLDADQDMTDWKAGRIHLGFIHPASAGHGLNLQSGGHILVWLTPTWSLELYEQTNARLFRQGQTHPVTVVRILATPTIDQRVVKALESKDVTQSALIAAVKAELREAVAA